ncbi:hypothetical protein HMPREF2832_05495 [Streptococcus sp. HMSC073D05]|jgi:hypothetical protein|uniref:hypothetical protein n=1 Tax=Streptococcus TaxID=1301 RepID=UPI0008A443DB|nr:hypothetical protein [Streptococcus sp. HMSC073D05]OFK12483.1 hypothetical protein HMPREF2832_05495 [Streptococcus sp. HMSC073D05]
MKQKMVADIAGLLQHEFHGGYGIKGDHGDYAAWSDTNGIHICKGRDARFHADAQVISWEDAAKCIGELLEEGIFVSNVEIAEADRQVRSQVAQSLLFLYHDRSETGVEAGYLSCLENLPVGYPAATEALADMMTDPDFQKTLQTEFARFALDYSEDSSSLRFHYYKINLLWNAVYDLSIQNQITKQQPKALLYYQQHGFSAVDDFSSFCESVEEVKVRRDSLQTNIVSAEHRMKEIAVLQTHITNYLKTKEVYAGYRKSGYSKKYYTEHADDMELCKKSKKAFDELLPSDDSGKNSRHIQKEIDVFERASGGVHSTAMREKGSIPGIL